MASNYGPSMADGKPRYFSATSLSTGDPNEDGGCLRKWVFKYVLKVPMPQESWQTTGVEMHNEIEHYLKTGERTLGPLALAIAPWIPTPGPDLEVEREIWLPSSGTPPPFTAAGIGVVGKQDLRHRRGEYIDTRGELRVEDGPRVVEVIDWKSSSDITKWAKPGDRLLTTVQMATYGKHECSRDPDVGFVRLSQVYSQTRGARAGKKTTTLASREAIERRWESVEGVARSLVDASRVADGNQVDANTRACGAYRGCPYRSDVGGPCTAGNSLTALFGSNQGNPMSLLNILKVPDTSPAVPAPAAPAKTSLADMRAEIARLEAEEREANARAELDSVPGFAAAVKTIDEAGRGWPVVAGDAARLKAIARGVKYESGASYAGSGELAALPSISDPAIIVQLAAELTATAPAPVEATPVPVVADVPSSMPELLPPGADAPVEVAPVAAEVPAPNVDAPPLKAKRGRPAKSKESATIKNEVVTYDPAAVQVTATGPEAERLEVYVDCIPSVPYESMHDLVQTMNRTICDTIGKDAEGVPCVDIRCAGNNTALAFGKWKGVLYGYVLRLAKDGGLPRGTYVLDTRGSDLAEVVADALRGACDLYVRGVR